MCSHPTVPLKFSGNRERALQDDTNPSFKALEDSVDIDECHDPCSLDTTMHYLFDFTQQVHYLSNPMQPQPIYFKTLRGLGSTRHNLLAHTTEQLLFQCMTGVHVLNCTLKDCQTSKATTIFDSPKMTLVEFTPKRVTCPLNSR